MIRMQVYLPEELFIDLKTMALVEDITMSELVREGLRKTLKVDKKRADPMKIFVGKCKAKEKTNAVEEVNSYYRKKFK